LRCCSGLTATVSAAFSINDEGTIAGSLWPDQSLSVPEHAFRYSDAAGLEDLGTVSGGWSVARAQNRTGITVGWSGGTETHVDVVVPPDPRLAGARFH
jgi:probable HAF family extracellular repeat protein